MEDELGFIVFMVSIIAACALLITAIFSLGNSAGSNAWNEFSHTCIALHGKAYDNGKVYVCVKDGRIVM